MINRATICGYVVTTIDTKDRADGKPKARFTVATSEYRPGAGGGKTRTTYHKVVVLNAAIIELMRAEAVQLGAMVLIEGTIEHRDYTDSAGTKRELTEIVLGMVGAKLLRLDNKGGVIGGRVIDPV